MQADYTLEKRRSDRALDQGCGPAYDKGEEKVVAVAAISNAKTCHVRTINLGKGSAADYTLQDYVVSEMRTFVVMRDCSALRPLQLRSWSPDEPRMFPI